MLEPPAYRCVHRFVLKVSSSNSDIVIRLTQKGPVFGADITGERADKRKRNHR